MQSRSALISQNYHEHDTKDDILDTGTFTSYNFSELRINTYFKQPVNGVLLNYYFNEYCKLKELKLKRQLHNKSVELLTFTKPYIKIA